MNILSVTLALTVLAAAHATPAPAAAATLPAPAGFACPIKHPVPEAALTDVPESITIEMEKRFKAVSDASSLQSGKVGRGAKAPRVDPALMTALAKVSGCAALIDRESSCSMYFSTHVGDPLALIMARKRTEPLRKQFDDAIQALPSEHERKAAQYCIKLTGKK